jgi:glycosyltransferase involved in cell wall biosynthesis
MKPLVTIITAVYNEEDNIEESILSVLNQTYDNIEYIIIDGGSTDKTVEIIKKYEAKIDYWISQPDNGVYDAWNKALKLSKGRWISFLGADDYYLTGAISAYVDYIAQSKKSLDYVSSVIKVVDQDKKFPRKLGCAWSWDTFKRYVNVAHVGSIHNRDYFVDFGLYDDSYKIAGDYEMLLRKNSKLSAGFINITTAVMRRGGVSTSFKNSFLTSKERLRAKIDTANRNKYAVHVEEVFLYTRYSIGHFLPRSTKLRVVNLYLNLFGKNDN